MKQFFLALALISSLICTKACFYEQTIQPTKDGYVTTLFGAFTKTGKIAGVSETEKTYKTILDQNDSQFNFIEKRVFTQDFAGQAATMLIRATFNWQDKKKYPIPVTDEKELVLLIPQMSRIDNNFTLYFRYKKDTSYHDSMSAQAYIPYVIRLQDLTTSDFILSVKDREIKIKPEHIGSTQVGYFPIAAMMYECKCDLTLRFAVVPAHTSHNSQ